jgi:photosystem II stability/assembly factor-like uncharacterized protein
MPSFQRPFLIGLISLALAAPVSAGAAVTGSWTSLGPEGGAVWALASPAGQPQVIYAGVFGGAYKSVDGGSTWKWAGDGLDLRSQVTAFAFDPFHASTLYAVQTTGLFKSVDGGSTWKQTGLAPYLPVLNVAIHPKSPQIVFAATVGGLYQSTNGGGKWRLLTRGLIPSPYIALAVTIDPSSPRRMFATLRPKDPVTASLFKSLDGGYSWQAVHSSELDNQYITTLKLDPRSPKTLYVIAEQGLLRSTDDGRTWKQGSFPGNASPSCIALPSTGKSSVYAGGIGVVYRSVDAGATWSLLSQDLPPDAEIRSLLIPTGKTPALLAGVDLPAVETGVFRSTDGGTSWTRNVQGLTASVVTSIAVDAEDSNTLWAAANFVLFKSADRGRTWSQIPEPRPAVAVYDRWVGTSPVDPQTVYLGRYDGQVLRSRDGGETWSVAGNPSSGLMMLKADPLDAATLWAGGADGGLRRSTDGGDTWSTLSGLASGGYFQDLAFSPTSPSTLYAGGQFAAKVWFLRSTDAGADWDPIQQGLAAGINSIAVDPLHAETVYSVSGNVIYKTIDGGNTWTLIESPVPNQTVQLVTAAPPNALYAAVRFDNVYVSEDGGQSWSPLGTAPKSFAFYALAADPQDPCRIYAAANEKGLLAFTRTGTAVCP